MPSRKPLGLTWVKFVRTSIKIGTIVHRASRRHHVREVEVSKFKRRS